MGEANYSITNDPINGLTLTLTNCTGILAPYGVEGAYYYKRSGGSGTPGSGGGSVDGGGPNQSTAFTLTENIWANSSVPNASSVVWYKFNVTSGTKYYVWWNDYYFGDETKTGDVEVRARYSNDTYIFSTLSSIYIDSAWTSAESFTATQTGTVFLEVRPYTYSDGSVNRLGTFGIVYSTNSNRPSTSGTPVTPSYSLNGVWYSSDGEQITVSGSVGIINSFGNLSLLGEDAVNRGYYNIGDQKWRNLASTGTRTWSGQTRHISYNTSSPNVATGTVWRDCTITMSVDQQTITFASADSGGPYSYSYTRTYTPTTSVYIAGGYGNEDVWNPCYWVNGTRTNLNVSAALNPGFSGIAVMGNTVYISGIYELGSDKYRACYWANGTNTDLSIPTAATSSETKDIAIQGNSIYIVGSYETGSTRTACYWVNGARTDLSVSGRNSECLGISIQGNTVYILGLHGPSGERRSCYWVGTTRTDLGIDGQLPDGSGSNNTYFSNSVMLGNNYIYRTGEVLSSSVRRACYWRNGYLTPLSVPAGTTYSTARGIAVQGSTVYITGRYDSNSTTQTACYWANETRTNLSVTGYNVSRSNDISVTSQGAVYVCGNYGSTETWKACYWVDGSKIDLSVPTSDFSNASKILVVQQ
jgi:hypothetical protein